MRRARWLSLLLVTLAAPAGAQVINASRLAILQAEERRAGSAADLATIRAGARSADPQTVRIAIRALGRLERPALIPDILPALTSRYAEVRAEAANAVAQAASGLKRGASGGPSPASLLRTLGARLSDEDDSDARAALAESIGRLPYADADSVAAAQQALVDHAAQQSGLADRLSVAKAFEALVRLHKDATLSPAALDLLRGLVGVVSVTRVEPLGGPPSSRTGPAADPLRDTRVRRLAIDALTTAGAADAAIIERGVADVDPQVRRLGVRAAARAHALPVLTRALEDPSAMVRLEALRGLPGAAGDDACAWLAAASADADPHVILQAIDLLSACGRWDQAVTRLADFAADAAMLDAPRGWHRAAHALVALATAAPDRAAALLQKHAAARSPVVRVYAARAAEKLKDRATLERLAADPNDNVVEAAVDGLANVAGADAVDLYIAVLQRRGYQAVRAGARALEGSAPAPDTIAALNAALDRLVSQGHANSTDAREALTRALEKLGATPATRTAVNTRTAESVLNLADLRRFAAPRARLTVRDVGIVDVALITREAPAAVVRFARLAESGYYDGLTIHRVVPNFVLQGGSPDANEYVGHPDHMRDELGLWPHVRGAVGISTRGRDTGDAQIFIDLVDNPRLDHEYTVFGQVIAGLEVADRILEGDVIDSVQILDGR